MNKTCLDNPGVVSYIISAGAVMVSAGVNGAIVYSGLENQAVPGGGGLYVDLDNNAVNDFRFGLTLDSITTLTLFNLPVGEDMDGKALLAAFEQPRKIKSLPSWDAVPGDDGRHPTDIHIEPSDAQAAIAQLVALGYIAPPDENPNPERKSVAPCVGTRPAHGLQRFMQAGSAGNHQMVIGLSILPRIGADRADHICSFFCCLGGLFQSA